MNTDDVRFLISGPDMIPSHICDLHVSQLRDGNDACTRSADREDGGPAGWRLRSHPARRRTAQYLVLSSGFPAHTADRWMSPEFYNRRV
ncbi:hypothetical protein ACH474_08100 [Nocardia rhamnosiphila]|jgi:hypothetical protein|uniref:Uncharacterized protein n=1 Tax=Nocardia rhamnosiphila TaxID=426716 RepID=A0ABV2WL27_9NOCA|nr:hypothetical protein [Nocardia rhamnosiphila]